jgi:protein gp37
VGRGLRAEPDAAPEWDSARLLRGVREASDAEWPLPNVWLGVSVEHQQAADERIPLLLQTPAAVRFLSCEPLLGAVDLSGWLGVLVPNGQGGQVVFDDDGSGVFPRTIDWVIAGG